MSEITPGPQEVTDAIEEIVIAGWTLQTWGNDAHGGGHPGWYTALAIRENEDDEIVGTDPSEARSAGKAILLLAETIKSEEYT